ncbi:IclR family transcriptional regulator [Actinomadura welshii]
MGALDHAFAVLEGVSLHQPVGVSELARRLEINKTTAQRALIDLERHGWIRRAPENEQRWILTTKALSIGARHRAASDLRSAARPIIQELARHTGETIHLTIFDGVELVLIEQVEAETALRTHARIGDRALPHLAASGLVMMAAMRADELHALLDATAQRLRPPDAPLDRRAVLAQVETARSAGYLLVRGTRHPDVSAIAAAVLDAGGAPRGAISISMPTHRLAPELVAPFGEAVAAAAQEI